MSESEQEYEIEALKEVRQRRGKRQFLVKWVGYDKPTWEPEGNLPEEMVHSYLQEHNDGERDSDKGKPKVKRQEEQKQEEKRLVKRKPKVEEKRKPEEEDRKSEEERPVEKKAPKKKNEGKGDARERESERIVDAFRKYGSEKVVYTLKSNGERTIITSRHAKEKYPEQVIEYFESCLMKG